jgi:SAM-dependent methyltransferase
VALLGYPAAIEPVMRVAAQATLWSVAYVAFVLLCGATAWTTMRRGGEVEFPRAAEGVHPGWRRLALWSALAFCPSALLVAITSHLTQNIAPIPLLWVVPLTLYLLSFILTFESSRWYGRRFWFPLFIASVALMLGFLFPENRNADPRWVIPFFLGGFFICAVTCHGELYRVRPEAPLLTSFYLALSLGGALGGLFVGVLAPSWFNYYYEVPLALLGAVIAVALVLNRGEKAFPGEDSRMIEWSLLTTAALGLLYLSAWLIPVWCRTHRFCDRNFYGVLRVEETAETDTTAGLRELHHGTINHGSQFLEPARRLEPTTYYGPTSGVALAIAKSPFERPRRIGVIGLGTGTLAAYGRPGDWYRFYEINSMVVSVAQREFFYLKDTPANHSIALGDARLSLEREPPQNFDVLAVDAFSGDSIPTHLLTVEAFREYLRHTRPGGVVALHVSNRYLELDKVVAAAVSCLGISACQVEDGDNEAKGTDRSDWVLITGQKGQLDSEEWQSQGCKALAAPNVRMWTDDYSNILDILK